MWCTYWFRESNFWSNCVLILSIFLWLNYTRKEKKEMRQSINMIKWKEDTTKVEGRKTTPEKLEFRVNTDELEFLTRGVGVSEPNATYINQWSLVECVKLDCGCWGDWISVNWIILTGKFFVVQRIAISAKAEAILIF